MKAAIITDNSSVKSFGDKTGFTVHLWDSLNANSDSAAESMPLAPSLLKLLGFEEGKATDNSQFDLVFLHIEASKKINDAAGIHLLNRLVGELGDSAQSGTEVGLRLLTSVILSYGATLEDDHVKFPVPNPNTKINGFLGLIPRQSYMMKGGKPRENVR